MSDKINIYQRINAVMKDCDYLQKKKAQQGKGVKYDDVIAMLRPLLIKHGVVMVVRQGSMECVNGINGSNQKVYEGLYELDLVNMDDPKDKVTHTTYAHGMDGGDKAPGKAQTYAIKILLVKGFGLETGEDEESRAEKMDKKFTITEGQYNELGSLVNGNDALWNKVLAAFAIKDMMLLPSSKFDQAKELLWKRDGK